LLFLALPETKKAELIPSRLVRSLGGGDFQLGPLGRETEPEETARAERTQQDTREY